MKALFIGSDLTAFDAGSTTRARLRAYAAAIGELHYLSRAPQGAKEETDGALTLHPLHAGKLLAPLALSGKARALIRKKGIEVVSAQDPFEHGWAAASAVRGTAAALHIQVHTDFLSPWYVRSGIFRSIKVPTPFWNKIRLSIARKVLPQASAVRAVSKRVRDSIVAAFGTSVPEPSVLPIVVDAAAPPAELLPEHAFGFAFMTSGRLAPEKRIEDVLMALGKIAQRYPSVGLVIVGDGPERPKLETLARKLGLSARVLFLGEQGAKARAYLGSAHCFLQTSAYEGYGRSLIEAALAKVPIITTDVGIVGEVFRGYEEVLATPPGDTANLAAHMTAIIGDHQLRHALALNAEQAARTHLAAYADQPRLVAEDLKRALSR